jgi:DNA-binding ferritin-like protein (Dps family)
MFGRNSWTDRLRDKLTDYVDEKFVDYRDRLANDLARGVGALAVLAVKWSLLLLLLFFSAVLLSFLAAELFRPLLANWSYVGGFGLVLMILILFLLWMRTKLDWMEHQVFEDIRTALLEDAAEELVTAEEKEGLKVELEEIADEMESDLPENLIIDKIENPELQQPKKGKDPFRE